MIPTLHEASDLYGREGIASEYRNDRGWVPSRPLPFYSLWNQTVGRIALAWGVLTGKYDALDWGDRDEPASAEGGAA